MWREKEKEIFTPGMSTLHAAFASLHFSHHAVGQTSAANFYSIFEAELSAHIPVVYATVAGCKIIGRLCVGFSLLSLSLSPNLNSFIRGLIFRRQQARFDCT